MPNKIKILDIKPVTHDVKRFVLEKPKGYKFIPGQATDVSINKDGWIEKKRPFTFTSCNEDDYLEFVIKGYPRDKYPNHTGVTEEIHKLNIGDELLLGDPWGTINYQKSGIFIAGGAGITPFIAIFRKLKKDDNLKGNKLIFSNKEKKDIILEDELREIFQDEGNLILTLTRQKAPDYEGGRVDSIFLKKHIDNFNQDFYICGPKSMVSDLKDSLEKLGASTDSIVFQK